MILIAAVDEAWNLGYQGQLLVRISQDMKQFRQKTTHQVIVVGRKTLESFPGGRPLPDRINVVLTRNQEYRCPGVTLCHSIEEVLSLEETYPDKTVFVAGGGSIYRQLLPHCQKAYITKIKGTFPADTCLENLDTTKHWHCTESGEWQEEKGIQFSFCTYERCMIEE